MLLRTTLSLILLALPAAATALEMKLLSSFEWSHEDPRFGGFSGIHLEDGGDSFLAISDRGHYAKGRITRDNQQITQVVLDKLAPLPLTKGRTPNEFLEDAEGLAVSSDGTIYISYESHHRVWTFKDFETDAEWTHKWDFFWKFQPNSGLEALAVDAEGAVYAIPERSGKWERPFPVYRLKDGKWEQKLSLKRSERFLVVGADFGPDGKLYLLERDFNILEQFKSRIRRFELTSSGFDQGETVLETSLSALGNAEGISLWIDHEGRTIVTIIADDNFNGVQKTWITEYELKD